ncbi:hypothetical protein MK904_08820 [Loigolactobacillus coryniformis]|jgi:membrane-bound ClpP family serine protease|uniref:NfeD-like C-terminal domain-containing protein n=2 Tax=Loigolactobacillus coryniformis TaxID=1610 RepID=A0A0R1F5W5_9LACO|nr:hypothetical protein [Loigolactobacillus coryniformis]OEH89869.1 hypothetical protein ATO00_08335 [Loigolactobacillus coryniformis subsp. coryniformis]ATO55418.1 hypothetical protein LC20001_07125 [Loigolactobacillus coryniformis subsp. coryniformis KCTC 3167 = DSM 20001]KRK17192.1 hypothetical protein FD22_GL000989 [Loigolactobacillus coryniformis subsp. coryniformis KCTC 3167 = DSM 20001]MBW4802440.1 hypothetical protein [Loigolactobacillus coryniformis subsp. torquens]MBW4805137.1 hypoth
MNQSLDARLLGRHFIIDQTNEQGTISFFGIFYHFVANEPLKLGDEVVITAVTAEHLTVTKAESLLKF